MNGISCDRCDNGLLLDAPVRYEVRIEVKSAYDPMELTREDLASAEGELHALIENLKDYSSEKAQDEVYRKFKFDLCATCQKAFLAAPLGKPIRNDALRVGTVKPHTGSAYKCLKIVARELGTARLPSGEASVAIPL